MFLEKALELYPALRPFKQISSAELRDILSVADARDGIEAPATNGKAHEANVGMSADNLLDLIEDPAAAL